MASDVDPTCRDGPESIRTSDKGFVPSQFGRYIVLEKLGQGGMGQVFSAYDTNLGRKVALKRLAFALAATNGQELQASLRDALLHEARTLAKIAHPNVVPIFDVGVVDDEFFLAMEKVEGTTLRQWMSHPSRPWPQRLAVLVDLAQGLTAVHRHGLVHRDIKPDNVMVSGDGRAMLLDFGLALRLDRVSALPQQGSRELDGAVVGTPAYMSPEQHLAQELGVQADVFSFCATAYEVLLGVRPFAGPDACDYLRQIEKKSFQPAKRTIPTWLYRAIVSGLADDKAKRLPSLQSWLKQVQAGMQRRRQRWWALALALSLGSMCLVVGVLVPREPAKTMHPVVERIAELGAATTMQAARQGVLATGLVDAVELWQELEAVLEERRQALAAAAQEFQELPDDVQAARVWSCLAERTAAIETMIEILARASPQIAVQAIGAVQALPAAAICRNAANLSMVPQPHEPALRQPMAHARVELSRIRVLVATGGLDEAYQRAMALRDHVHPWAYFPVLAEIDNELGLIAMHRLQGEPAAQAFSRAINYGIAGNYPRIVSISASFLPYVEGYLQRKFDTLQPLLHDAYAWLVRANFPATASAEWHRARALVPFLGLGPGTCEADFLRAIHEEQRQREPDLAMLTTRLSDYGQCQIELGKWREGAAQLQRAVAFGATALGENHPALFIPLHNLAVIAEGLGHLQQAQQWQERAQQAIVGYRLADTRRTIDCHQQIGLLLAQWRIDRAIVESAQCIRQAEMSQMMDQPLGISVLVIYGRALELGGKLEAARAVLATVIESLPHLQRVSAHDSFIHQSLLLLLQSAHNLRNRRHWQAILAHLQAVDQTVVTSIEFEVAHANGDFARMLALANDRYRQLIAQETSDQSPYVLVDALCNRARAHAGLLHIEASVADFASCVALIEQELGALSPALAEPLLYWSLVLNDQSDQQLFNLQRIARLSTAHGLYPPSWAAPLRQLIQNLHDRGLAVDEATGQWVAQVLALP